MVKVVSNTLAVLLVWLPALASSFAVPQTGSKLTGNMQTLPQSPDLSTLLSIRGGDTSTSTALNSMSIINSMGAAMQSGPFGVVALAGVASSVVVPLTMYRQAYSFSVGYGLSVFAMAIALIRTFDIALVATNPVSLLAAAVTFYGARLGLFLLFREWTVPSKAESLKKLDKSSRLKRIPLALGVSLFYALMTSPLMYAARAALEGNKLMNAGVVLAWSGALMEAIADGHKWLIKRRSSKGEEGAFVGPTGGLYRLCRHPNYFAEVFYWFGLALAGAPSFGRSPVAWGCAASGLYGIYGLMTSATKRLEGLQGEKYGEQEAYQKYTSEVVPAIWPWARGKSS